MMVLNWPSERTVASVKAAGWRVGIGAYDEVRLAVGGAEVGLVHHAVADVEFALGDVDVGQVLHAGHDFGDGLADLARVP